MHVYEIYPRKDKRGFNLISDALPFTGSVTLEIPHAIGYAKFYSRSYDAVIRVYDDAGNVIEMHDRPVENAAESFFCLTVSLFLSFMAAP